MECLMVKMRNNDMRQRNMMPNMNGDISPWTSNSRERGQFPAVEGWKINPRPGNPVERRPGNPVERQPGNIPGMAGQIGSLIQNLFKKKRDSMGETSPHRITTGV
jgi:hypothetical protein